MKPEVRAMASEARATGDDGEKKVSGMGIVYDTWTELFPGFRERINRGAVKNAPMVKSYFNHDPGAVLSTLDSDPPLVLRETDAGLEYISPIPPTSYGKDLEVNLARKNVRGSSFAFGVPKNGDRMWEDENGVMHREINSLTLYEIGPVTDPAYITTSASLRSAKETAAEWRAAQVPVARLLRQRRQVLAELDS